MTETFGQRLRFVRKYTKTTQKQLAESVGVDHTYLSKLENDKIPPPSGKLIKRILEAIDPDRYFSDLYYYAGICTECYGTGKRKKEGE